MRSLLATLLVAVLAAGPLVTVAQLDRGPVTLKHAGGIMPDLLITLFKAEVCGHLHCLALSRNPHTRHFQAPHVTVETLNLPTDEAYAAVAANNASVATISGNMADAVHEQYPNLFQVPIMVTGLAVTYNLPGFTDDDPPLVFDRELVAKLFMGAVNNWNATEIRALNPGLAHKLPNAPIVRIVDQLPSPTSEMITTACASFFPAFASVIPASTLPAWDPYVFKVPTDGAMAMAVSTNLYTLSYLPLMVSLAVSVDG